MIADAAAERVVTTSWGASLVALLEDESHHADFLESGISWPVETEVLTTVLRTGMSVLDVGANFGYLTSFFATAVGEAGQVVAVEPEPVMADLLHRNTARHSNTTALRTALGATGGNTRLWRSSTNLACHSLIRSAVPNPADSVIIPVTTVDALYREAHPHLRPPDLVKIDVEGAEAAVLNGAGGTLHAHRPVLWLEFWPEGLRHAGTDPAEVTDHLTGLGYTLTAVDLVSGDTTHVDDGAALVADCDRATERYRSAGRPDLYGLVYLLAIP